MYHKRDSRMQILRLAFPIIIQNLFSAAISSTDVIMLNSVGQSSISAVSLAVQYSNILYMIYYGIGTGVTLLSAQYWGKGNLEAIQKVEGIALRFAFGISLLFAIPAALIPGLMMQVFTADAELIAIGRSYLRIVSVSYLCWGFSETYLSTLRSVERVKMSTALNVGALLLNILLNAVFIYGLFGAPRLGATGVALATSISRFVQLLACLAVSRASADVRLRPLDMFRKGGVLLQDFLHLALPALGNDIAWSVAFSVYCAIMGHMSSDVVAANSIVVVVRNFSTVFCFAIASASGIYLGKEIGANQLEEAREDGRTSLWLTVVAALIGSVMIAIAIPFVLRVVSLTDTATGYLRIMLWINTYYIVGQAVNTVLIAGIFRAGGDTKFGLICDVVDMWGYGVPLGLISAFVLKLPPMWVYFLLCTDEFVKWPWVLGRYRSGKWLNNITRENI